ncbi:MAG: hypothetical protein MRJ96_07500 [Nitrospirales bacterium]|nr:type II toxin-antitoxin system RelE/ParE family toxin [Nitrospira sp.]MDR4501277.1 hypothetical protein [Nitrospirales bacterium]
MKIGGNPFIGKLVNEIGAGLRMFRCQHYYLFYALQEQAVIVVGILPEKDVCNSTASRKGCTIIASGLWLGARGVLSVSHHNPFPISARQILLKGTSVSIPLLYYDVPHSFVEIFLQQDFLPQKV